MIDFSARWTTASGTGLGVDTAVCVVVVTLKVVAVTSDLLHPQSSPMPSPRTTTSHAELLDRARDARTADAVIKPHCRNPNPQSCHSHYRTTRPPGLGDCRRLTELS
jgi:hypothetical protein